MHHGFTHNQLAPLKPPTYSHMPCMQGRLIERSKGKGTKLCVAVRIERKQTAMHYQSVKKKAFLKIVLATPTMVTQARGQPMILHKRHPFVVLIPPFYHSIISQLLLEEHAKPQERKIVLNILMLSCTS